MRLLIIKNNKQRINTKFMYKSYKIKNNQYYKKQMINIKEI